MGAIIKFVNPSHYVRQIKQSLKISANLNIPVIYNTNAYKTIDGLKGSEGLIQVIFTVLNIWMRVLPEVFGAPDYFEVACTAIKEVYRTWEGRCWMKRK